MRARIRGGAEMSASADASPRPLSFVVVGSCIVDFCVSVPRLPEPGETVLADSVTRSLGGKGANQATALRRLGGEVAIVACVGCDDFGEAFLDFFRQEGIETGFLHRDPSAPTGMAFPMVLPGGGNAIVAAPSASMRLPEAAVAAAAARIRQAAALLVQLEVPAAAAAAAMAVARQAGVPGFLNPAPAVEAAARLAAGADVLIPNEMEAEALTGTPVRAPEDALRAADRLRALGPEVVGVTLGERGAAVPGRRLVQGARFRLRLRCPGVQGPGGDPVAAHRRRGAPLRGQPLASLGSARVSPGKGRAAAARRGARRSGRDP